MIIRLFACFLLLSVAGCATQRNELLQEMPTPVMHEGFAPYPEDSTEKLVWDQKKRLAWHDFRKDKVLAQTEAAESWTGIEFSGNCENGEFTFEVDAIFHRDSSWVVPGRWNERLLDHEQGHFDLAELYARKLSQALRNLESPCENMELTRGLIQNILQLNQQQLEQEQRRYDIETRHGTNRKRQESWNEFLRSQLFVPETSAETH
jgi:hypothetical protein